METHNIEVLKEKNFEARTFKWEGQTKISPGTQGLVADLPSCHA